MSMLAKELGELKPTPIRKGPMSACALTYGRGDAEDHDAVHALHDQGATWKQIQEHVDRLLDIKEPIALSRFRYHWNKQCMCWDL